MNRRGFLRVSGLGIATLIAAPALRLIPEIAAPLESAVVPSALLTGSCRLEARHVLSAWYAETVDNEIFKSLSNPYSMISTV